MHCQEASGLTKAVDTLGLIGTNYNTTDCRAFFEQKHSIGITTFVLTVAGTRATVIAGVSLRGRESGSSLDPHGRAKGRSRRRCREDIGSRTAFQSIRGVFTVLAMGSGIRSETAYGLAATREPKITNERNLAENIMS